MSKRYIDFHMEDMINKAIENLITAMAKYRVVILGFSGGKDSSVTLDITIKALLRMKRQGMRIPKLVVHTNDTTVEQPEVIMNLRSETEKIKSFLDISELEYTISVGTPSLSNTWSVQLFSGRKTPTYMNKKTADCSVDYKVTPGNNAVKEVIKSMSLTTNDSLFIAGTRFDEGSTRTSKMKSRGESSTTIAKNSKNGDSFAPIADWLTFEVWTYLSLGPENALFSNGEPFDPYSDFVELNRLYSDASSTDGCQIFTPSNQDSKGCGGSRFGCWTCVKVGEDKSMKHLIEKGEQYAYLKPLSNIQQFIYKTQFDWEMRNPVSRTLSEDGMLGIQPDTLHPKTIEKLFIACLTVDRDFEENQHRNGFDSPRADQILTAERVAYLDAIWSLRGFFEPFHAWKLVEEVYSYKRSEYLEEEIVRHARTPIPKKRFLDLSEHFKPFDDRKKRSFWRRKFSCRDGMLFLEDESVNDLTPNINDIIQDRAESEYEELLTAANWSKVADSKLSKAISLDLTYLENFLEEVAGYRIIDDKLCTIEKIENFTPHYAHAEHAWGRCSGFNSYLTFGILKYSVGQRKWIENAISLTLARRDALGQWDIPTYNELISKTLDTRPESTFRLKAEDLVGSDGSLFLLDPADIAELDKVNEKPRQPKIVKLKKEKAQPVTGDTEQQIAFAI